MDSILSTSVDSYSIFPDGLIRIAHIKPATAEASETFTHRGVVPSGEVGKKPWLRAWTPPRLSPPRARGRGASLGCAPGPCQEGCDAEMAIRLAKAFGSTPEAWAGLQFAYDMAQAQKHADEIKVQRVPTPA